MGSSKKITVGYWYLPAYHAGLGIGPIDAFLQFRGGDKIAWSGELTSSGTITIDSPNLWGGEKDQGGIVGDVDVMFGESSQMPNQYLNDTFGFQQPAWRGLATLVFKGGKYGAMNPYPQKASYKIRKILKGWWDDDGLECWYPEKAIVANGDTVLISNTADGWEYVQLDRSGIPYDPGFNDLVAPTEGWAPGQSPFGSDTWAPPGFPETNTIWDFDTVLWARRSISVPSNSNAVIQVFCDNGCCIFLNGGFYTAFNRKNVQTPTGGVVEFQLPPGDYELSIKAFDEDPTEGDTYLAVSVVLRYEQTMNPAHILYYSIVNADMGREPIENINDASFKAAADWYYDNGFGLCTSYDPAAESVDDFQQRVQRVAGCGLTRNLIDGQWYLDIANGEYALEDLPVLTDDDILDFSEQPALPDSAVNSVSVKFFDPARKEAIVTPPVQAPSLISDFGSNHITIEYLEISNAPLAARVAQRELLTRITPLRSFSLKTTRLPYAWRPGTYFRLQAPKRGIADMVCILSEKSSGSLRSGAMSIIATQDVYSVPTVSFVEVEEGVDTSSTTQPALITTQRVFEAPYVALVTSLSRADLAAVPADAGYIAAVADDPSDTRDYTLMVQADGGEYEVAGDGDWTPTALIVEAAGRLDVEFTLSNGKRLQDVSVGMAALWGDEIVRVDAIDIEANSIELGRGCADTVPATHAAGERIWFYDAAAAGDPTEYTDAETVSAKLLDNTVAQQFPVDSAIALSLTFAQRQFRPYPPAGVTINGEEDWPDEVSDEIDLAWSHRDRVTQANVLVDTTEASVGPEVGTTYTAEFFTESGTTPVHSVTGITDDNVTWAPSISGTYRVELKSVRDGVDSWQKHVHVLDVVTGLWTPANTTTQIWLDASYSGNTVSSGTISQWTDRSGAGRHLVQSSPGFRPAHNSAQLNGLPVLTFDGASDRIGLLGTGVGGAIGKNVSQISIYCVRRWASSPTGGTRHMFTVARPNNTGARLDLEGGTTNNREMIGGRRTDAGSFRSVTAGTDLTASTWGIVGGHLDWANGLGWMYLDGSSYASSASLSESGTTSNTDASSLNSGSRLDGAGFEFFGGDIAEIIITHSVDATERQKIEGYLAHKWGLTSLLPGGHPYKSTPPLDE